MNARILALTIATLLAPVLLHAQTWDGAGSPGGNPNWGSGSNWDTNVAPVNNGTANVAFAGFVDVNPGPNLDQAWSVNSVAFNAGSGAFVLGSTGGFTLSVGSGGIVNNDESFQTINHPVSFSAATATINAAGGPLTFDGGTVGLSTSTLSVTGAFATGFTNFSGTGSVTKSGTGTMSWWPTLTTSADLFVNAGTVTTMLDGSTDVFDANASITVNSGGVLHFQENATLRDGAQLTRNGTGEVVLGSSLRIESGSDFLNSTFYVFDGDVTVTDMGSTMQANQQLLVGLGSSLVVQNGGSVISSAVAVGTNSNGTVTVNGSGTSVIAAGAVSYWGQGAATAAVTFSDGAVGSFAGVEMAAGSTSVASVQVLSGADITNAGMLSLSPSNNGANQATLMLSGAGSTWQQTTAAPTIIGGALAGTGTLIVREDAEFSTIGPLTINPTGTLTIEGGTLSLGDAFTNLGAFNFNFGILNFFGPNGLSIGANPFGQNFTLLPSRQLIVGNTATVEPAHIFTIGGGTLTTGALVNLGTLAFSSGTLAITGAGGFEIGGGALGANVILESGRNLAVTNTATIASGATLTLNGGAFTSGALDNTGTLRANSGAASVGTVTNGSGGRIFVGDTLTAGGAWTNAAGAQLTLENGGLVNGAGVIANSGLITGDGTIGMALANNSGGQVRAAAGGRLVFTGAAANNGTGSFQVSAGGDLQFTNTLANNAAIDVIGGTFRTEGAATNAASTGRITGRDAILRFNGGLANSGSLAFSFGTSDVFGDITNAAATGRIVVSGNSNATFYDDLVNSGTVQVSTGSTAVYFGAVSGAGSFPGGGTNFFEGDLAPGASPALVTFGGNVVYGTFMTIEMELGGTARGTGYDAINVAGNLGFNGTLSVPLIGGFQPQAGHVFNLFDWGTKTGTFSAVNLPALSPGLLWSQANLYTAGEIAVALDTAFPGRVWDGGGANDAWATDTNWDLNVEPLNNGNAQLVFAGNVRLTPSVDAAWNVAGVTFANTAGAFTITGPQSITLGAGGVTNNDADTQTITAAVTLSASQSFTAAAGDLAIGAVALGGHTLTFAGANDASLASATGSGTVAKSGAGTLDINGPLGTGGVAVSASTGTTRFHASQTLAALSIGAGATVVFTSGPPPAPFAGAPGAVPEPASAALILTGTALLLGRRRRPRHAHRFESVRRTSGS